MQRKLRVLTTPLSVGRTPSEVYDHANPEVILLVLMHKISQAVKTDGLQQARALLYKWLASLCAKHTLARASQEDRTLHSAEEVSSSPTP